MRASFAVVLLLASALTSELTSAPAHAQSTDASEHTPATNAPQPVASPVAPPVTDVSQTDNASAATLDEVLVTGEQPGPGLWKVTKGEHTLWILGAYGPLPKKMTWRSREVEDIIAESQRVVRWVEIDTDVDVGFFAGLAALPLVFTAGNNPDGAKLKEVVPAEAYAQWQVLKTKYVGSGNDMEKLRPAFAALELRSKASDEVGLSSKPMIWPAVERLAKKHKVKILQPEIPMKIKIDNPRAMIKKFRKTQLADVECFTQSLARLEDDLDIMRARANAWSIGKLDVLRQSAQPDASADCGQLLQNLFLNGNLADELGAREMMDRTLAEMKRVTKEQDDTWIGVIEDNLRDHATLFAVVPIDKLLDAHGPLQTLRDRGYAVGEPSALP